MTVSPETPEIFSEPEVVTLAFRMSYYVGHMYERLWGCGLGWHHFLMTTFPVFSSSPADPGESDVDRAMCFLVGI